MGIGLRHIVTLALGLAAPVAQACDTALILTIDVSNSIDVAEYRLQTDGMADALIDPEIMDELIRGQVAIMVIQWSGVGRQEVSIPWTQIRAEADVVGLSVRARTMPRAFVQSDTAIGDAVLFSLRQFADAPDCLRRVIDISGDGTPNAGTDVRAARIAAERAGVTINGIAIEGMGLAITGFFQRAVITRNGFVITALTHRDYPRAIRAKILREVSRVLG
ncbi:DUF1194 domain-containing protein [Octadecabacter sp. R77987]|uniref:DUF1194 domain-containing protein n=1 Tax=Octadecabacter sp. R77987 TaxID=3093874 RepID=UPI00366B9185